MAGELDELDRPNLTLEALCEWLRIDDDVPVTQRQLRYAVLNGELEPSKFSNRNYFSRRQGLEWVATRGGK